MTYTSSFFEFLTISHNGANLHLHIQSNYIQYHYHLLHSNYKVHPYITSHHCCLIQENYLRHLLFWDYLYLSQNHYNIQYIPSPLSSYSLSSVEHIPSSYSYFQIVLHFLLVIKYPYHQNLLDFNNYIQKGYTKKKKKSFSTNKYKQLDIVVTINDGRCSWILRHYMDKNRNLHFVYHCIDIQHLVFKTRIDVVFPLPFHAYFHFHALSIHCS